MQKGRKRQECAHDYPRHEERQNMRVSKLHHFICAAAAKQHQMPVELRFRDPKRNTPSAGLQNHAKHMQPLACGRRRACRSPPSRLIVFVARRRRAAATTPPAEREEERCEAS
eukprot:2210787-Pleurochrysis_carterae.AAC.1